MSTASLVYPGPRHRRPRLTLYGYMARESLRPCAFALFGLTVVVLTTSLLGYSELVINRGVGAGAVGEILFLEAIPVAARMLPFAVLVGSLVALGRMGAEREILALEASGVAPGRLVWPVVAFASCMTVVSLFMSCVATPWSSRRLDEALDAISRATPWAQLRAGVSQKFGEWQLEAREVSASGNDLAGVLLWMPAVGETIFARRGRLSVAEDGAVGIALRSGSVVMTSDGGVRYIRFESLETTLPSDSPALQRPPEDQVLGLALAELAQRAREFEAAGAGGLPVAALELHRRLAFPAAALVFGFLAAPLFLSRGNYSRSAGAVLGIVSTIAYYGLVQLSEGLVQGRAIGPGLGAWLPNLVMSALAAGLLARTVRERALGRAFERSGRPRRRKAEVAPAREPRLHRYALPRYVSGRFLELVGLSFSVLFAAYLLIDVMDRLEWFAAHGATGLEALRFYGARAPLLASRAVPMSILVATSLTVSLLAAEGELIGMRSCGIPAPRALLPVLGISTLIAPAYFLLNNTVLPRTNALADELKRTEIKEEVYRAEAQRRSVGVWYRSGRQVIEAARLDPDRGVARDVTIYGLGEDGLPESRTDAAGARHIGRGVWRLVDPRRIELVDGRVERVEPRAYAELGDSVDAEVDTMHLSVAEIAREVGQVEASGYDATALRVDYHVKLAEPLACLVLPALVLVFAVTGPPFPGPAQTLLVSGVIGVTYILFTGVSASLGRGGRLPPPVGGWAPILLFAILSGAFSLRMYRRL